MSHKDINPKRERDTCVWFLEHPIFQDWKASNVNGILWLSADPGSGNSVLSRALIDEVLYGSNSDTLCYFFKDNDEQNNTATALCALLHQFFCVHDRLIQEHVAPARTRYGAALKKNPEELWRVFVSAAMDPSVGRIVCILDALDECQQSDRNKLISWLDHFYRRCPGKPNRGAKLKFLVTSRPYNEIELSFSKLIRDIPTIRLAGETESEAISREIEIVMKARVDEIADERDLDDDVRFSLHRRLSQIPSGTYLWLHLTLDAARYALGTTKNKLLKVINTLPESVEEAYEKILARCSRQEAKKLLQFVAAAQRPLTLSEIDVALEIGPNAKSYKDLDVEGDENRKKWIRTLCGLFITVIQQRVYLIHQTAREFLIRNANGTVESHRWRHSIDLREAHERLAEVCVAHLLFQEFQGCCTPMNDSDTPSLRDPVPAQAYAKEYKFLDYSASNWILHVQEAGFHSRILTSKTVRLCDIGDGSSCTWFDIYSKSRRVSRSTYKSKKSSIYWVAVFGLINEMEFLLEIDIETGKEDGYLENAFQGSVNNEANGKESLTRVLERREAPVNITEEVIDAAAGNFHYARQLMELLLDRRGAEVEITEKVVRTAAGNQGQGREIVELLLDRRGAEVEITQRRWLGRRREILVKGKTLLNCFSTGEQRWRSQRR